MNKLTKMQYEVMSQMTNNETISSSMSNGLQEKINSYGKKAFISTLLVLSSAMVQADPIKDGIMGGGVIAGVLANGTKPEGVAKDCPAPGVSGVLVGGTSLLGAWVGSQFGMGDGKTILTLIGGVAGGVAANNKEEKRIRSECARYGAYANNPMANPQAILYEGRTVSGGSFVVTMGDSIGLDGLTGKRQGALDIESDPIVKKAFERSIAYMMKSHDDLNNAAKNYLAIATGKSTDGKLARYAVDEHEISNASVINAQYQTKLYNAKVAFDNAYATYSTKRAIFANIADNAVMDNYNITKYVGAIEYLSPPETASMTYSGNLPNRYPVLNNAVKMIR